MYVLTWRKIDGWVVCVVICPPKCLALSVPPHFWRIHQPIPAHHTPFAPAIGHFGWPKFWFCHARGGRERRTEPQAPNYGVSRPQLYWPHLLPGKRGWVTLISGQALSSEARIPVLRSSSPETSTLTIVPASERIQNLVRSFSPAHNGPPSRQWIHGSEHN